jgi:hypothetical protein
MSGYGLIIDFKTENIARSFFQWFKSHAIGPMSYTMNRCQAPGGVAEWKFYLQLQPTAPVQDNGVPFMFDAICDWYDQWTTVYPDLTIEKPKGNEIIVNNYTEEVELEWGEIIS